MGYGGWVHIRGGIGDEQGERHFDTVGGTEAIVSRGAEGLAVRLVVPGERKEVVYREAEGVVRVADLHPESAERVLALARQQDLTVEGTMSRWPDAKVTRTRDGAWDRYEVSAPAEDAAACADGRCLRPAVEGTAWADPATGLVRRLDVLVGGKRVRGEYTYGEPAIRDVYDLGVPREAPVAENRADAATTEVLDRLRRRYEAGFGGNYIAVATLTRVGEDGRPVGDGGTVSLYARSGEAFLANRYVVGPGGGGCGGGTACGPRLEWPAGWPTPELGVVLDLLRGREALSAFWGDGKRAWQGRHVGDRYQVEEMVGRLEQLIPFQMAEETLPGRVWPTREGLKAYGTDVKLEVVQDRGRPGLVGLRMDRYAPGRAEDWNDRRRMWHDVTTSWFDPLRDDVPVEETRLSYAKGSSELEAERRTTYTDWGRTPDGRWYPSAWRVVARFNRRGEWTARAEEQRLRVWAGERLGAEWFVEPTTTTKANGPPAD